MIHIEKENKKWQTHLLTCLLIEKMHKLLISLCFNQYLWNYFSINMKEYH